MRARHRLQATMALASAVAMLAAAGASAASFNVVACAAAPGNANNAWVYSDNAAPGQFEHGSACGTGGDYGGLWLREDLDPLDSPAGEYAYLTFTAAPQTTISALAYSRWLHATIDPGWHVEAITDAGTLEECVDDFNTLECNEGMAGGESTAFGSLSTPALRVGMRCSPTPPDADCEHGAGVHRGIAVIYSATVTITDTVLPAASAVSGSIAAGGWLRGTKTVAGSGSDSTGISRLELLDGSVPVRTDEKACDFTKPAPCPSPGQSVGADWFDLDTATLSDGVHTLRVRARDAAGNATEGEELVVEVDNTAPAAPIGLVAGGGDGWSSAVARTLSWGHPAGQASPITTATIRLCPAAGGVCTEQQASSTTSGNVTLPSEGVWTAAVYLTDAAGNALASNAATTTLRYDATAPGPPVLGPTQQGPDGINSFSVDVALADDGPAPLLPPATEICRPDGTDCAPGPQATAADRAYFSAPSAGTWLLRVWGVDAAGNAGAKTARTFTWTPPAPAPTATPGQSATPAATATVSPAPTPAPTATPTATARRRPLLRIAAARRTALTLVVRGQISRGASGPITVRCSTGSGRRARRITRTVRPSRGRISVRLRLPGSFRKARRIRVELRYRGDGGFLPRTATRLVRSDRAITG